ncbi:hypothetical protein DSUL_80048 [Desulfovibrionales bacterium]
MVSTNVFDRELSKKIGTRKLAVDHVVVDHLGLIIQADKIALGRPTKKTPILTAGRPVYSNIRPLCLK